MANRIEQAGSYLGSLLKRSSGIEAFNLSGQFIKDRGLMVDDNDKKSLQTSAWVYQVLAPATTNFIMDLRKGPDLKPSSESEWVIAIKASSAIVLDLGSNIPLTSLTLYLTHNPVEFGVEFVIGRLAINAATHVSFDVLGAAAKRVKTFRPSSTTLAG